MINLDPGVLYLPYTPQIDIRNTINYKELMTSHGLGPNGAIMTALNLYAAKFNEVLEEVDNNKKNVRFYKKLTNFYKNPKKLVYFALIHLDK